MRIVESESEIVRQMFHWFVQEGLTLASLSKRLQTYGI